MKNQKSYYVGLRQVFNNAGKNRKNLDIIECLVESRRHQLLQFFAWCMLVFAAILVSGMIFTIIYFGPGASFPFPLYTFAVISFTATVLIIIAFGIRKREIGRHVLGLATDWKLLINNLKDYGVDVRKKDTGPSVALEFERHLCSLVLEILVCEKKGEDLKRDDLDEIFKKVLAISDDLFKTSDRGDFFTGEGKVEYIVKIPLRRR